MSLFDQWYNNNFEALNSLSLNERKLLWNATLELIANAVAEDASRFGERHHASVIKEWKV